MNTSDDDLLAALRRSADPSDRRLADLLGALAPAPGPRISGPRANDALTSFLVSTDPTVAGIAEEPAADRDLATDLVVHLGRPAPAPRRRSVVGVLAGLRGGPAKAVLAATVALVGAGTAAASGAWHPAGPDTVVATPTSGDAAPSEPADEAPSSDDVRDGVRRDVEPDRRAERPDGATEVDEAPAGHSRPGPSGAAAVTEAEDRETGTPEIRGDADGEPGDEREDGDRDARGDGDRDEREDDGEEPEDGEGPDDGDRGEGEPEDDADAPEDDADESEDDVPSADPDEGEDSGEDRS